MLKCWFYAGLVATAFVFGAQFARGELAKSTVLEGNVGYLRVAQMDTNLPNEMQPALNRFAASTNKIAGIVLDLRFASGADSDSVKATEAVLEQQKLPLAILVNAETTGTAANLAYDLRQADAGLVFGAGAPDTETNLQPDVVVSASANDEKLLIKNPYGVLSTTNADGSSNILSFVDIDHTSEADLEREKINDDEAEIQTEPQPIHPAETPKSYIRDPVLVRGVDFLKGLAALHLNKS